MLLTVPMLILWMQISQINGQEIQQNPQFLLLQEGEDFTVYCNSSVTLNGLRWYRQRPGSGPVLLITLLKGGEEKQKRLTARFGEARKDSSLHVEASQTADAGTYFCAGLPISTNNDRLIFGAGTRLQVFPNITDPDPAVYQLKSPKSSKTSVCLFTDFDSEKKMPQSQEGTVIMSNGTVLDMRVMDSKSNGVLAWSNSTDFKCNSTFNEKFYSSSDFSCNATLIEKSFETDMNLNAHNLLVMGLRVLLLKVAGFNLFVTLRLWSR